MIWLEHENTIPESGWQCSADFVNKKKAKKPWLVLYNAGFCWGVNGQTAAFYAYLSA